MAYFLLLFHHHHHHHHPHLFEHSHKSTNTVVRHITYRAYEARKDSKVHREH